MACAICNQQNCYCVDDIRRSTDLVAIVQSDLAATGKRLHGRGSQYTGPCPLHNGSDNNFSVFYTKGQWFWHCHSRCGTGGDLFNYIMARDGLSFPDTLKSLSTGPTFRQVVTPPPPPREAPAAPLRGWQFVEAYHRALLSAGGHTEAYQWWVERGLNDATIERFKVGYCTRCPVVPTDSYTIPIIDSGKLLNIRHRLAHPNPRDPKQKYAPHAPGLGAHLFNRGSIQTYPDGSPREEADELLIVEGEIKAMVLASYDFESMMPVVTATAGSGSWLKDYGQEWMASFPRFKRVYVCFDPDALDKAEATARLFGRRGCVVEMPDKLDDFLNREQDHGMAVFMEAIGTCVPLVERSYWRGWQA